MYAGIRGNVNSKSARLPLRALDESTALQILSSLVGQESFGVVLLRAEDSTFRLVFANDTFRALFPDATIVGMTLHEVFPEDAELGPVLEKVARTGRPWVSRNHPVTLHTDGMCDIRYYTYRMQRIMLEGRPYIMGTALDVTAETRARRDAAGAKEELDRSESAIREHERIEAVLQAANELLDIAPMRGDQQVLAELCIARARDLTASEAGFVARLDGSGEIEALTAEGMPGIDDVRSRHARQDWLDDTGVGEPLARLMETGLTVTAHSDQQWRTGDLLLVPLSREGAIVGVIGVARREHYDDLAIHSLEMLAPAIVSSLRTRQATSDLYASKQLLEAHVSSAPMAVIEFDTHFRVTRWSEESERMFGYAPEEVLGRRIVDMQWVYEEDAALVEAESRRMFVEGVSRSKNLNRNYRKDGSVIWCEWYSSAIHDESGMLISVLSRVFDVTARRQAEEQLLQQAQQVKALKSVAEEASSALELKPLAERLVRTLADAAGADLAMLVLADDEGGLRPIAARGASTTGLAELRPVPADAAVAEVYSSGRPIFIEDVASHAEERRVHRALHAEMASVAALPMLIEEKPIGVLALGWRKRYAFDESAVSFLQSLVRETAVGVQNALLFEAERSRRRLIQSLHGVLEVAVSSLDAAEAAQRILDYLMEHHTFDLANCWLARGESLELLASINYPPEYRASFSPMPLSAGYDSPKVHLTGEPLVVTDSSRANPAVREMYASIGVELGSYVIVPLRSRGRTVGTLNLGWHQPRSVTPNDLAYFESLGSELGVVLENAVLMRERTEQASYAEALNRINEAVHSTLEFNEIMQRVVVEAAEVAGFHRAAILLRRSGGWHVGYSHNLGTEDEEFSDDELDLLLRIEERPEVVAVDVSRVDQPVADLLSRHGVASYLAVPLMSKGQLVGYLAAWSGRHVFVPEDRQVDFMRKVGATVSLALENVRLYETERSIADRLQSALLTIPDQVPGVRFAHEYRSATEAARVGGDFYDLFELGGNRVGIVIGDVAGKGIDAAVLTSLVKNTVQAHASEPGKTPAQVLELTNDMVFKSTSMEAFVTVFFGVLDCRDGTLLYANGGHTSGALVRAGGPVPLSVTGPLLGAFGTARFRDTWARLDVGDVLFLYTDGLTEARSGSELFGEQRVFDLLEGLVDRMPEEILPEVVRAVVGYTGGHLGDDMAILAIQLTGCDTRGPQQQRFPV